MVKSVQMRYLLYLGMFTEIHFTAGLVCSWVSGTVFTSQIDIISGDHCRKNKLSSELSFTFRAL